MIQYERFAFASPPRSATSWFRRACSMAGLGDAGSAHVHVPPPPEFNGLKLSIVRHPYDWLRSYYHALQGGCINVPVVDVFASHARSAADWPEFARLCLRHLPGSVGAMWNAYAPSTVMRVEDLRWAVAEFFGSLNVPDQIVHEVMALPVSNATKLFVQDDRKLRREIEQAEPEFCERYEY